MSIPKLRFKEFDGNWENTSFQSLFSFKNGINASKEQYGSGTKFINVLDIINNSNGITFDSIIGSVQISGKEIEKNIVKYGDVLFQRSSETREEVGQSNVYLSHEPVVFGGFVIRGTAQKEYDPIFMNSVLKTEKLRDQITQLSGGSTRFNIGQDSLNKIFVDLPNLEEQTKIASFLSQVDEKINQLTQKHSLLSQYKQGMMQKLFSQQIRFKADDGSKFGEWEKKELKAISQIYDGTHQTPNYVEEGVPFYSVEHVTANNFTKTKFIAEDVYLAELKRVKLEKGDILLTRIGDIGTSRLIDWEVRASFYVSLALIKVKEMHSSSFVNQYIKSPFFQRELHERTIHVAFPKKINLGEIGLCVIKVPCLEEQTKIANFLSAIDQKIAVVAQQIEQAKQWKKGLLQQMFV